MHPDFIENNVIYLSYAESLLWAATPLMGTPRNPGLDPTSKSSGAM